MFSARPFQIVVIAVFGGMALIALIILGGYQAQQSTEELTYGEEVVIWGTLPERAFDRVFQTISEKDKDFNAVVYYQVDERDFDSVFVNAIAEGRSPDMVLLQSEDLVKHREKLVPIPYDTLSQREYRDRYVDGAEIFLLNDGAYAVPLAVDPLLMYWNRDTFASYGLAQAPATWEAVVGSVVPRVTVRNDSRAIIKSGLAFGEYRNIKRAKDILMMLNLQSGSLMVSESEQGYRIELDSGQTSGVRSPLATSLQFFTDFSNANSPLYSWSRAMPEDQQAFIAGDLALYFGRGSEAPGLNDKNPNLNFDVATVPQGSSATARRTYGTFYGFAIPRASRNTNGSYAAATVLANGEHTTDLTRRLNLAPVRRDLVAAGDADVYRSVMLESALIARAWLDPNPAESDAVFQQMVEDVVSNRSRVSQSVTDAMSRLRLTY